jgi:AAA15 family ATPase/GTPase
MPNENSNHLTYFKVQNFKCFDSIELEDIGLINFIVGDNNVGKTSLLEALTFENDLYFFNSNLEDLLFDRDLTSVENTYNAEKQLPLNFYKIFLNQKTKKQILQFDYRLNENIKFDYSTEVKLFEDDGKFHDIKPLLSEEKIMFRNGEYAVMKTNGDDSLTETHLLPLLGTNSSSDLVEYYEATLQDSPILKKQFIEELKYFIPDLLNIEIRISKDQFSFPHLIAALDSVGKTIPLSMFGEGSLRFFKILMAIIVFKKNRLMIDEIDNGFHYSRLKSVFRSIVKSATSNQTQLFISTHNSECLRSFKEVLEEIEFTHLQKDVRSYSLKKLPNESIKAYKYNFEEFEHAINQEVELR